MDMFLALCTISGYRVSYHVRDITSVNQIPSHIYEANIISKRNPRVENIDFHGGKRSGRENGTIGKGKIFHPNEPTVYYQGKVWCPETEYGTFVARRNAPNQCKPFSEIIGSITKFFHYWNIIDNYCNMHVARVGCRPTIKINDHHSTTMF